MFEVYAALSRGEKVDAPDGPVKALVFEELYTSSSDFDKDKDFWSIKSGEKVYH